MARPRGNEWLEDEVKKLAMREVNLVVSLLEESEIIELGIEQEELLCHQHQIEFVHFPIQDRGFPNSKESYFSLIKTLYQHLSLQKKIVVHCRMGIGRASLMAAGVLMMNGSKREDVFDVISYYRGFQVPDTIEQITWFNQLEWEK